jgi:hypothetical protein
MELSRLKSPATIAFLLMAIVIVLCSIAVYFATAAMADVVSGSTAISGSSSNVRSNTNSSAMNAGNSQSTSFSSPGDVNIRNVPAMGGLALGGGHPCAYSPATGQLAIFGGGIGVGGMKVDDACMLMVMGVNDPRAKAAAEYMIAARDPAACNAMLAYGMVGGCSGNAQPKGGNIYAGVQCIRDTKRHLTKVIVPANSTEADKAADVLWCKQGN